MAGAFRLGRNHYAAKIKIKADNECRSRRLCREIVVLLDKRLKIDVRNGSIKYIKIPGERLKVYRREWRIEAYGIIGGGDKQVTASSLLGPRRANQTWPPSRPDQATATSHRRYSRRKCNGWRRR